jgi:hypothetical protein
VERFVKHTFGDAADQYLKSSLYGEGRETEFLLVPRFYYLECSNTYASSSLFESTTELLPSEYLTQAHVSIKQLLEESLNVRGVNHARYEEFRAELLQHIGVEEHIVLPLVEERSPQRFFALRQIRLEHKAIAVLLALPPTGEIITVLKNLLLKHDFLEETPDTLYDVLDKCSLDDGPALLTQMQEYSSQPLSDIINTPPTLDDARRAVYSAGYTWEKLLGVE